MTVYFKRNTNIYISKVPEASANATNTVLLNVKDFSYNRTSRVEEVSRETLNPTQERIIDPYVTVFSPVEFTFTTYILSTVDTNVTSPEEYLWTSLMGADTIPGSPNSTPVFSRIDFSDGNVSTLPELTLWFDQPNQTEGNYRIDNAIVDSATINFDINGIAEIQWMGRGLTLVEDNTPPAATDRTNIVNYIKNKLSTIVVNMNAINYTLALIGGSIRIENNVQFYGRTILGQTTSPEGHFTNNRKISGNVEFYMRSGTNESVDLFNQILTNANSTTYETNYLAIMVIHIGGSTNTPRVSIAIPQALLELGRQNFGEVISVNIPFIVKEETNNYMTITYYNN